MLRHTLVLATLATSAFALSACGSAPSGESSETTSSDLVIHPGPPISTCGIIGLFPCAAAPACRTANSSVSGGLCECDAGYALSSSGVCALDEAPYPSEITDYLFGSALVTNVTDDFSLNVSNNVLTLSAPPGLGISLPPPISIPNISGSKDGVSYSATIPSLALNNWQWSASDGINLAATLQGDININLSAAFSCNTMATLSNVPVNVGLQIVNGATTVTSATVDMLDHNNVNYSSGCTIANIIGSTTLTSALQGALQSQLQNQIGGLFAGDASAAFSNLMTNLANDGLMTCTSGCSTATLPVPSAGWSWTCSAANTTPAGITGTCQRH